MKDVSRHLGGGRWGSPCGPRSSVPWPREGVLEEGVALGQLQVRGRLRGSWLVEWKGRCQLGEGEEGVGGEEGDLEGRPPPQEAVLRRPGWELVSQKIGEGGVAFQEMR